MALFFLAFVPQFIASESASKVAAFLFLGLIFNINGTLWNTFVAWISSRLSGHLANATSLGLWLNRAMGSFFVGLGIKLALSART